MRIVSALTLASALALALSAAQVYAGQDGAIDLVPYGIDPITGNRTTPDFGACQATVASLYGGLVSRLSFGVYARLAGATLAGMTLAEFYLQGLETNATGQLPAGWTKNVTFPSPAVSVGSISDPEPADGELVRRCDVVWPGPECKTDALVLLALVDLTAFNFAPNFADNHYVSVVAGVPSLPPEMACPFLALCDFPYFTKVCVTGGQLIINPSGPACTVAVEQATWSRVKGLYR